MTTTRKILISADEMEKEMKDKTTLYNLYMSYVDDNQRRADGWRKACVKLMKQIEKLSAKIEQVNK